MWAQAVAILASKCLPVWESFLLDKGPAGLGKAGLRAVLGEAVFTWSSGPAKLHKGSVAKVEPRAGESMEPAEGNEGAACWTG